MIQAERRVTLRDYLIFVLKLFLDGLKDGILITVSTVAIVIDVLSGGGKRPRLFYSVLRMSERFDLWLNLNGAMEELDAGVDDDGLFGASRAGADTLLGKLEQMVRGGDEPRGVRGEEGGSPEPDAESIRAGGDGKTGHAPPEEADRAQREVVAGRASADGQARSSDPAGCTSEV